MFLTQEKISARVKELNEYRYREKITIPSFNFYEERENNTSDHVSPQPPKDVEYSQINLGDIWKRRDRYAWLNTKVNFPEQWKGKTVVGLFDLGKSAQGNTSGFESLLYVNGSPYQGVDSYHQEVFFNSNQVTNGVELDFRLWSGLEGMAGRGKPEYELEHKINRAEIAILDSSTDDLYYTSKTLIETLSVLDQNNPEFHSLLKLVNKAFFEIDWSQPGSEIFYKTVRQAQHLLNEGIEQIGKNHPVVVKTIGHTHIDVAWLWRLKHTREKAARSFSTVLRLMERFPEYIFLQTQPQLYEYIKHDFPEIYEQIKKRVKEGRWEAEGGMWLEPDCNIPAGESFVRQLLYGKKFLKEEFNVDSEYLWLPDVFGYSWALPQILKKSGIKTFMTTKISWNQYNRMPHDTFHWRGIDGTEILTHFITTPIPGRSGWQYTYNGELTPETVKGIWDVYRDKDVTNELLIAYGYGDGGGGVNREMLEMRRRLDKMPGIPKVKTGKAGDFFNRLHQSVENTEGYVHTWDGELYLELHRGTYTSQAHTKKMNRKVELQNRETELLGVMEAYLHSKWDLYPTNELYDAWIILLRNQFHDILPGSSIKEVYEDSDAEFGKAMALLSTAKDTILNNSARKKDLSFTVLNDASWIRTGIVEIEAQPGMENGNWLSHDGKTLLASEKENDVWLVETEAIPSLGTSIMTFEPGEKTTSEAAQFKIGDNSIQTPYYHVNWNEKGQLISIYDFESEREVLQKNAKGNAFQVFEDKPLYWDAWDIDIFYQEKMREVNQLNTVKVIENNSLRSIVRFEWQYGLSMISQDMIMYSNQRRIDFKTHVNWQEKNQLLKVAFPVDIRSTEATFDIQFGNVKRPTHWNTSWDYAKFETAAHQWADLSETGYGVSLLNDSKYGYDVKDNVLRLSLIRSAEFPDRTQDIGEHDFVYSLYPHQGNWIDAETPRLAWDLNQPVSYVEGLFGEDKFSTFSSNVNHIVIDAVKKAESENKVIVRLHENTGKRGNVVLESDMDVNSWQECNLMEEPIGDKYEDQSITFPIQPYEIKTYLVEIN